MSHLCCAPFILRWTRNALWEQGNHKTPKIRHLGFRGVKNLSFATVLCSRFVGSAECLYFQLLNEDFEFGLCFIQYGINFSSGTNSLHEHMVHIYNFRTTSKSHTIGQGSILNLRICERCVGRTLDCLQVNWLNEHCHSTVRALYEHWNIWTKLSCGLKYNESQSQRRTGTLHFKVQDKISTSDNKRFQAMAY